MRYVTYLLIVIAFCVLSSCSYIYGDQGVIRNRDTDYLKARSIAPLKIPPGLSSSTIATRYPVSDIYYPGSYEKISLIPPELNPGQ